MDLFTIKEIAQSPIKKICILGDCKGSRAVHSFARIMRKVWPNIEIVYVCPKGTEPPEVIKGPTDSVLTNFDELDLKDVNIVYVVRSQKERHTQEIVGDYPVLTSDLLKTASKHLIILHPLPRRSELPTDVDSDKRAAYFKQARNCLPVRTAICELVLARLDILRKSNIS